MAWEQIWWWAVPTLIVFSIGVVALIVKVFDRELTSGGPRATTGGGGMFGALNEVFDPGAHRAELERERMRHQVAVTPSPGPDADRRPKVVTDRFGNPVSFRPGASAPASEG